jgi:hypothetical protein
LKSKYLYITILAVSLLGYFVAEWARPKPIDWTESYSGLDKRPYGNYILRNLLPDLFPGQPVNYRSEPVFSTRDSLNFENIIFINSRLAPDEFEAEKLLKHVENGKNVFIAAKRLGGMLGDTLKVDISGPPILSAADIKPSQDSVQFAFTLQANQQNTGQQNAGGQNESSYYPEKLGEYHFSSYDTLATTVLGTGGEYDLANFIQIKRGEGAFFIHAVPYIFTNYYVRDYEKAEYAFRALSHLPVAPTVWDEYYKAGRRIASSPLRYIVSRPYLKWAWITTLAGLFLFLIFRAKRRQRIIPEIPAPKNTSLEFTRTMGRLYHRSGDHKDLAEKKITYFLEYIRDELNLNTAQMNDDFIGQAAQRAGVELKTARGVFSEIDSVQDQLELSSKELWKLNEQIETFYRQSSR